MQFFYADATPEVVKDSRVITNLIGLCSHSNDTNNDDDEDDDDVYDDEMKKITQSEREGLIRNVLKERPEFVKAEVNGCTALIAAAVNDNVSVIDLLLREFDAGRDLVDFESAAATALIAASENGSLRAIDALVAKYGANVNLITKIGGRTALIAAAAADKPEVCVTLIDKYKADVNLDVVYEHQSDEEDEEFLSNAMLHACANNSVSCIYALKRGGAHIDFENQNELFPVLVCAKHSRLEALNALLMLGADATAWGMTSGLSALLLAIIQHDEDMAKILIKKGQCDINVCGPLGRTIFCECAARGDIDAMKLCRKLGGRLTLETNIGRTPLHDAAFFNHPEACAWLCERGTRVDRENALGETAMSEAALNGSIEAMRFLKANGGSVDFETSTGVLPILNASFEESNAKALRFIVEELKADAKKRNKFGQNCFTIASKHNNLEGIKICLDVFGFDVDDDSNGTGELPLVAAARSGALDAVWMLCERGAKANKISKKTNDFALGVAAKNGKWRVCGELFKKGADVYLENDLHETPLHCAALSDDEDTITCLLSQCGAVVDHQNELGETSLFFAARDNKVIACLTLLSHGAADGLAQKGSGYTPLMIAIENRNIDCIEVLLEAGASVVQLDENNETSAMKAVRAKNCIALKRILEIVDSESDLHKYLSTESVTGETALTIACKANSLDVVNILLDSEPTLLTQESKISSNTALLAAIDGDSVQTLDLLLSRVISTCDENNEDEIKIARDIIDYENKIGHTALVRACLLGHQDCVRLILDTNLCDVNRESDTPCGEANVTLTPLFAAIEGKNARPIIAGLFDRGCDINRRNRDGITAVMHAALLGRTQYIVSLAGYGGDVNQATLKSMRGETQENVQEEKGDTSTTIVQNSALIAAVLKKKYDVVEFLERSSPERDVEINSTTALFASIESMENDDDDKMIKLLLSFGEDPAFESSDGRTALSVAALIGNFSIMKLLMKHSKHLNINSQNRDGLTVLSILALAGKNEAIKTICSAPFNADPNFVDRNGRTALTIAVIYADEARAGPFPCVWRNGNKDFRVDPNETFTALLSAGAKINLETPLPHCYSAIHEAAKHCKNKKTIEILIDLGADPNAVDGFGFTPLMRAVEFGNLLSCEALCKNPKTEKDKVLPQNSKRKTIRRLSCNASHTALTLATLLDDPNKVIKKLLDLGCDCDRETLDGDMALRIAVNNNSLNAIAALLGRQTTQKHVYASLICQIAAGDEKYAESIRKMLAFSGSVSCEKECSVQKQTALVCGCFSGHEENIQALVESGANVDSFGSNGVVPIVAAIRAKRYSIMNYLVSKKCEMNMIPTAFESPLRAAVKADDNVSINICLNAGADIEEIDAAGISILQEAARLGAITSLKALLSRGAAVNRETPQGTALIQASLAKQLDAIDILKAAGASLDAETSTDDSAQIIAATVNDSELLHKLNQAGASMDFETRDGRTPLNVASREGNLDAIKAAIEAGANINYENRFGETALVLAIHAEQEGSCKILLERGANINFENFKGETFLMMAAKENDVVKCGRLLKKGALLNKVSEKLGSSALMVATEYGSVAAARFFVDKGAKILSESTKGKTALSVALEKGEIEILKLLARAGHDIEVENSQKLTPLCVASASGDLRAMACLLDLGAIVNKESSKGMTPLCVASEKGRIDAIHLLCDRGAVLDYECAISGETALTIAAKNGRTVAISTLVERGANVDLESSKIGMTALGVAAISGAFSSVHALSIANCNLNYVGESSGKTALMHAAERDDPEAISVLLEVGCAIDFVCGFDTNTRHCALTAAAKVGAMESLKFLIHNGANPAVEPTIGRTALVEAINNNQLETVSCLASIIDEKDYETSARYTAMTKAAMNGNIEAFMRLRKCGEDVNYETSVGDTPLIISARLGNNEMIEELLVPSDAGSNVQNNPRKICKIDYESIRNAETALLAATKGNHIDCIKLLRREGAVFDRFNRRGSTALFTCCSLQETGVEVLESLLTNGSTADLRRNVNEMSALFSAAQSGRSDFVPILIKNGVDIEHVDSKTGLNALAIAIQNDRVSFVKSLVDANADVDFEYRSGETALTLAVRFGRTSILELLLSSSKKCSVMKETTTGLIALHLATSTGRFECAYILSNAKGADINFESKMFKETPLICATKSGNSEMCVKIVEMMGADVDFITKSEGVSALMVACSINEPDVVRILIDLGANPDLEDLDISKQTALQAGVKASAIDSMIALIECGADPNFEAISTGFTPLLTAAELNLPKCCKALVAHGADPNYETKAKGFTALSVAAMSASNDAITQLIAIGASVNNEDAKFGRTALISAAIGIEDDAKCAAICELLIRENAQIDLEANFAISPETSKRNQTALMSAARCVQYKVRELTIRRLVFLGAKINFESVEGDTALNFASREKNFENLDILIKALGADVDRENKFTHTPLMSCLESDNFESCAKLLKLGADPLKENRLGHSAMSVASKFDSRSSILSLHKEFKFPIDSPSKMTGERPLDVAVSTGARDATNLLLSLGADINAKNPISQETALMHAAKAGQIECIGLLLREPYRAKTKLTNINGETALTIASSHGHLDCVNAILENLEEPNEVLHETKRGDTALTLAVENGHEEIVSSLYMNGNARIEYESNSGKTALIAAVSADRPEMIHLLADLSSKLNKEKKSSKLDCIDYETTRNAPNFVKALHYASLIPRRNSCMAALVTAGANVDGELSSKFSAAYGNFTPLMCAVLTNNISAIYQLINLGAAVDYENSNGISPLMMACEKRKEEAFFALLTKGANPRFETRLGKNALISSFARDSTEMMTLQYAACGSVRDEESIITGATPLIHAVQSQFFIEAVPALLRLGENISHVTRDGRTALIAASLLGCADRVAVCLRNGSKTNQETRTGATALSALIEKLGASVERITEESYQFDLECENTLKFLLTNSIDKADVNQENKNGLTPAIFAARVFTNNPRVLALLLDHGANKNVETSKGSTLLLDALQYGCDDAIDLLISEGVDVNYETRNNSAEVLTPLIFAAKRGSVSQIEQLLAAGAEVNYETRLGETALMAAVSASRADHVSALLSIGNADANYEMKTGDVKGCSAIVLAGRLGHTDVIHRLISTHNIDPSRSMSDKKTPLIRAVVDEDSDAVRHMLLAGVPDNSESADGLTPLIEAAKKPSRLGCLQVLCEFNVSIVDFETSRGFSALHEACKAGNAAAVVALCKKYGADPNRESTRESLTPLMIAAEYGNIEVVEKLITVCGADANRETVSTKHTVLTHCAFRGKTAAFHALVSNGALVDRETQDGRTAVLYAIARDDSKTVEELVKVAGADVEFDSSLGVTPLVGAATANKPRCAQVLLNLGAKPLLSSRTNKVPVLQACLTGSAEVMKVFPSGCNFWDCDPLGNGESPLFCAAQKSKDVAKLAIECGATLNYESKSTKRTALAMAATIEKRSKAFDVLVSLGAVATSTMGSGETAIDVAFMNNSDWCAPNILAYTGHGNERSGNVNYVSPLAKETALMYCCRRNLVDVTRDLVKTPGINVNFVSSKTAHRTALIVACDKALVLNGDDINAPQIIEILVNEGKANVDFETETGKTALIVATERNNDVIIRKLIYLGANVNRENKFGISAFSASIEASADSAGTALVELGADAHGQDKVNHDTPLIRAVRIGDTDAANFIMAKTNADPNTETETVGETALIVACRNVDARMVELLLRSGANAAQKSSITRLSPFESLCSADSTTKEKQKEDIINMFFVNGDVDANAADKETLETPLMVAARCGDAVSVECLVRFANADVNDERSGRTALIRACGCGDIAAPAVEMLLNLGADATLDVTLVSDEKKQEENVGDTCVHSAVRAKSNAKLFITLAKILEEGILDIEATSEDGLTPLQLAASLGKFDAMSNLVKAGAQVNAESRANNNTALTYCAKTNNVSSMIHLVKKCGATVDFETSLHETALMAALKCKNWKKAVDALLNEINASATIETSLGDSAITVAFEADDEDKILKILRDGKVDVTKNPFTQFGDSLFGMCARRNCAVAISAISKHRDTEFMNIDTNLEDYVSGNTALCLAAALGHDKVVHALIVDASADASFAPKGNGGVDPLCDACAACPIENLLQVLKILIVNGKVNGSNSTTEAGWTPLMLLADRPADFEGVDFASEIIDYLIEIGKCDPTRVFEREGAANGYHAFSWAQLRKNNAVRDALSKFYETSSASTNVSDVTALKNFFAAIAKDDSITVEGLIDVGSVRDASVSLVLDDDNSGERVKAILYAVRCGANESIKVLAAKNANLNGDGLTIPIVEATFLGKIEIVRTLASVGADVDLCSKTHEGANSCAMAALTNRDDILRFLCQECKANLNAANCESNFNSRTFQSSSKMLLSPLMYVATREKGASARRHAMECLVNRGALADFEAPASGETCLTLLARLNYSNSICELAVVSKLNVNRESVLNGFTPLIAAVENNAVDAVRTILEELSAKIHLENSRADTAILAACRYGSVGALKILLEYAVCSSEGVVDDDGKILLNNSYGVYPVIACSMGGANSTTKNAFEGVLDVFKSNEKVFKFDMNCEAFNGQTALTTLFVENHDATDVSRMNEIRKKAKVLLKFGSSVDHENAFGKTTLDTVIEFDDALAIEILIKDLKANPNRESIKTGYTPLMLAAEFDASSSSQTLLKLGASANQISEKLQCDAMDLAHHRSHDTIKQVLLSFGAIAIAD